MVYFILEICTLYGGLNFHPKCEGGGKNNQCSWRYHAFPAPHGKFQTLIYFHFHWFNINLTRNKSSILPFTFSLRELSPIVASFSSTSFFTTGSLQSGVMIILSTRISSSNMRGACFFTSLPFFWSELSLILDTSSATSILFLRCSLQPLSGQLHILHDAIAVLVHFCFYADGARELVASVHGQDQPEELRMLVQHVKNYPILRVPWCLYRHFSLKLSLDLWNRKWDNFLSMLLIPMM